MHSFQEHHILPRQAKEDEVPRPGRRGAGRAARQRSPGPQAPFLSSRIAGGAGQQRPSRIPPACEAPSGRALFVHATCAKRSGILGCNTPLRRALTAPRSWSVFLFRPCGEINVDINVDEQLEGAEHACSHGRLAGSQPLCSFVDLFARANSPLSLYLNRR